MFIMILLNLSNLLMLGDAGAYVLSFLVGYLIIKCHYSYLCVTLFLYNTYMVSMFENLFSIIRKLKNKSSPFTPDNNITNYFKINLKKKIITSRLAANNFSSIVISLCNFLIIFISSLNLYSSIYQIKLIIFSTLLYLSLYLFLKKNLSKKQL